MKLLFESLLSPFATHAGVHYLCLIWNSNTVKGNIDPLTSINKLTTKRFLLRRLDIVLVLYPMIFPLNKLVAEVPHDSTVSRVGAVGATPLGVRLPVPASHAHMLTRPSAVGSPLQRRANAVNEVLHWAKVVTGYVVPGGWK